VEASGKSGKKKQLYLQGQRRDWDPSIEEPIAEQIMMMSLKPQGILQALNSNLDGT
jgi:hypothetical protein